VLPVGGVPVLPVGGAEGDVWRVVPALPDGVEPPAGAVCAATQVAHTQVAHTKITDNKVTFFADIIFIFADIVKPPAWICSSLSLPSEPAGLRDT
jgi:hypothetical protein